MSKSAIRTELQVTEASESKERAEAEVEEEDPENAEEIIKANEVED